MDEQTKTPLAFAKMLRIVAAEFQAIAAEIERTGNTDSIGEIAILSTYGIEAQGAIYDLMKQDKLL